MPKKKILIIDDQENFGKFLKCYLEKDQEYEGITATSGKEGLALLQKEKPDLILLDIIMPDMDGIETLKRIKEIDKDIPVCIVTVVMDDKEGQKCFEAGAYEYVTKPIDFEYLKTAIFMKLFA
ncbi:MAG: response regulator [Candidatus Omnitrophica bacterium]|nr:response regulator [Candidatus Omnitrophota bacterium]